MEGDVAGLFVEGNLNITMFTFFLDIWSDSLEMNLPLSFFYLERKSLVIIILEAEWINRA